jgi:hypothetical protein
MSDFGDHKRSGVAVPIPQPTPAPVPAAPPDGDKVPQEVG